MQPSPSPFTGSRLRAIAPAVVLSMLVAAGTAWAVAARVATDAPPTTSDGCPAVTPNSYRAQAERARSCVDARMVERLLVDAGASKANVRIGSLETGSLVGPDRVRTVTAQVFLPAGEAADWDARGAATAIAHATGTTPDQVVIADGSLQTLFDGAAATISQKRMDESANPLFHGAEVPAVGASAVTPPS